MSKNPFFSIVVPTYNRAEFLPETITSILAQTFDNFELIIVDDGSVDATADVVQTFLARDSRIRYIYQENAERAVARNNGMANAKGDYAIFFDSDDLMLPAYLMILHTAITDNNFPGFVAAKYRFQNAAGEEWPSSMAKLKEGWYDLNLFLEGNILACNFCVRLVNQHIAPFPQERELASMEDWLFLLLNLRSSRIFIKDAIGVVMREHEGRSMANNRKIIAAREKATNWALQHIQLNRKEQTVLMTFSAYFCGVHEYIEGNRMAALKFNATAFAKGGLQLRFILLLIKSIIGQKNIHRFQRHGS